MRAYVWLYLRLRIKGKDDEKHWSYYLPKPSNLEQTTRAWYEHIGALVQWATQ